MKWTSLPRHTPAWLRRHPLLLADWIACSNAARRLLENRSASLRALATGALIGVASIVAALAALGRMAVVLQSLLAYWVLTFALTAMYAAIFTARQRRWSENRHAQSWLIGVPIHRHSVLVSHAVRSLVPLFAQFALAALLIILAAHLGDAASGTSLKLISCITAGVLCGGLAGWWLPQRSAQARFEASRYVPRVAVGREITPSIAGLSGWPIAQVMAWSRPENSRVILVAALFAVQGGSSAIRGLSVVAMWLLAGYLSGLLSALLQAGKSAALWLRSTPISLCRFAWSIVRRALLHQILGTAFAAAVMLILGASGAMTLYLCALWISIVIVVSALSLADSYRGRSPALRIALSLATMAVIESREQGWSIPFAAFVALWQFRPGRRRGLAT